MKKLEKNSYDFMFFKGVLWISLLLGMIFVGSCGVVTIDTNKLQDLEVTLVQEQEEPEELKPLIEERKAEPFQFTFQIDGWKYLVVGYGEQETGGYSISVEQLYETSNGIYLETNLIGPYKGEQVPEEKSYPYLVVKIPATEKSVVFE